MRISLFSELTPVRLIQASPLCVLHTALAMHGQRSRPPWAPWSSGGPDVSRDEIPGASASAGAAGRRAPVREAAPLRQSRTLFGAPRAIHASTLGRPTRPPLRHSATAYTHDQSMLPPSPPPSPPPTYTDYTAIVGTAGSPLPPLSSDEDTHSLSSSFVPTNAVHIQTTLQRTAQFDVPGTPDMSPANMDVRHHPAATAEAFLRRIFVDWNASARYKAEDAGVELLCRGWTGAVVQNDAQAPVSAERRALYVHMPRDCDRTQLRDHMLRILDTASDSVCASRVVFCLERNIPDLASLLHGMCYVGGQLSSVQGQRDEWMQATPLASLVLVTVVL